jgi:hypothetical protein
MLKIKMIVKALEHYGNYNYTIQGYDGAIKYWSLAKELSDLFNIYGTEHTEDDLQHALFEQLTLKDILLTAVDLAETMETEDILNLPMYIGDDDELNGVHCAWYGQVVNSNSDDDAEFVDLINENADNIALNGKAILIS